MGETPSIWAVFYSSAPFGSFLVGAQYAPGGNEITHRQVRNYVNEVWVVTYHAVTGRSDDYELDTAPHLNSLERKQMLNYKPISVDRARMQYFQAVEAVKFAGNEIERDVAKSGMRKATQVLQHAQRMDRNNKVAMARAKTRRRVDWNVAVF